MTHFGNSPSNTPKDQRGFAHLSTPPSTDAIAFMRSGLGEEVAPGFFILNKHLALTVTAMRIQADTQFLVKEAELAETAVREGGIPIRAVVKEVSDLLDRLEARIDTKRGVFLAGEKPTVGTNLIELALCEMPQFRNASEYIRGALNYVTRGSSVFVIEGAQWSKSDLLLLLLTHHSLKRPKEGDILSNMYEKIRETLEASPELLTRLQEAGICPPFTSKTNAFTFWSNVLSSSQCAHSPQVTSWLRLTAAWPEELDRISNDGVFIATLIPYLYHITGRREIAKAIISELDTVFGICVVAAQVVDDMYKVSHARVARSN